MDASWRNGIPRAEKRPCARHQDKEDSRVPKAVEMMQRGPSPGMVLTRDVGQPQVAASAEAVEGAMDGEGKRQTAAHSQPSDGDCGTHGCPRRHSGYKLEAIF